MNKNKLISTICLGLSALYLASFLNAKTAFAQYYSQGEGSKQIIVDKKVRPINDDTFYDNIDPGKKTFIDGEQLEFKITVKNTGEQILYNIEVKDILPQYLTLLFFPGVYNKTDNNLVTKIDQLNPGESKDFYIRANISSVPKSTVEGKKWQQINKATATTDSISDSDQSQYFISGKLIPATGDEDLMTKTMGLLLVSVTAFGLRKLARGY